MLPAALIEIFISCNAGDNKLTAEEFVELWQRNSVYGRSLSKCFLALLEAS
jgi:hypothetical protein